MKRGLEAALPFIVMAVAYVLTMPSQFIIGDGFDEISEASSPQPVHRATHLLVTPYYRLILNAARLLQLGSRGFLLAQIANIITAVLCALVLHRTLSLLGIARGLRAVLTLLLGLSNGMWIHAVNVETGIHAQFFWMVSVYFLVKHLTAADPRPREAIAALLAGCASLLFALNKAFLLPVVLMALLLDGMRRRAFPLVRTVTFASAVIAGGLILVFFAAAHESGARSSAELFRWLMAHPESDRLSHIKGAGFESVMRAASGMLSAFADPGKSIIYLRLTLSGEPFRGVSAGSFFGLGTGLLTLFVVAVYAIKGTLSAASGRINVFCWSGLAILLIINSQWLGSDPQFWLAGLPLALILAASGLRTAHGKSRFGTITAPVLLALPVLFIIANIPRGVPSIALPLGGPDVKHSREFARGLREGDAVFTPGWSWAPLVDRDASGVRIYHLVYREDLGTGRQFLDTVDELVSATLASGGRVYFDGIEGPPFAGQAGAWEMFHSYRGISRGEMLRHLRERYGVRELADTPEGRMSLVSALKRSDARGEADR